MAKRYHEGINTRLPFRDGDDKPMQFRHGTMTFQELCDRKMSAPSGVTLMANVRGERFEVAIQPGKPVVRFMTAEELMKPRYRGLGLHPGQNVVCPSDEVGLWVLQNCANSLDKDHVLDVLSFSDSRLRNRLAQIRRRKEELEAVSREESDAAEVASGGSTPS